jgi:prophage regulatory protein
MQELTLAVGPAEAAKMLGISPRHFRSMNASGRLPAPIRLGRSPRWAVDELRAWLLAGSPSREKWNIIRQQWLNLPDNSRGK